MPPVLPICEAIEHNDFIRGINFMRVKVRVRSCVTELFISQCPDADFPGADRFEDCFELPRLLT